MLPAELKLNFDTNWFFFDGSSSGRILNSGSGRPLGKDVLSYKSNILSFIKLECFIFISLKSLFFKDFLIKHLLCAITYMTVVAWFLVVCKKNSEKKKKKVKFYNFIFIFRFL